MKNKKRKRRLKLDLSPSTAVEKKIEAEIIAVRSLMSGVRQLIELEVQDAIERASHVQHAKKRRVS